jgi:hypothetical protein
MGVKKGQKQSILVINSHKEAKLVKSSRNLPTRQTPNQRNNLKYNEQKNSSTAERGNLHTLNYQVFSLF